MDGGNSDSAWGLGPNLSGQLAEAGEQANLAEIWDSWAKWSRYNGLRWA